ncbi:hypothetical protein [Paraburkholderia youngii]|uniref:MFS transporter n=1 Tax=Paraburkholderia youngii TaxID=2782701 RepID=A0A7Y6MXW5_9BURK|nr:hypothetical protein [Paraburkholderia youngii]NUX98849.1 MFS transporter [Paraburkholderia youngii]
MAITLGAFWSSLSVVIGTAPFRQGSAVVGMFGFAGAAGALAAPMFGALADSSGPLHAVRIDCTLLIASFATLIVASPSLWTIGICAVVFDLGVMAALVSHPPDQAWTRARSCLNGMLMTGAEYGMALGPALGGTALQIHGRDGLWPVGVLAGIVPLIISFLDRFKGDTHG